MRNKESDCKCNSDSKMCEGEGLVDNAARTLAGLNFRLHARPGKLLENWGVVLSEAVAEGADLKDAPLRQPLPLPM